MMRAWLADVLRAVAHRLAPAPEGCHQVVVTSSPVAVYVDGKQIEDALLQRRRRDGR